MKIDKYPKIVIMSTLAEQKTLVDISTTWFQNKGRLYQPIIIKEIKKATKDQLITQTNKKFYKANMKNVIDEIIKEITIGENHKLASKYKQELKYFYNTLGEFTNKVYLNFDIIKILTNLEWQKAEELDLKLLIQLPFILRYMENKDPDLANIFIQVMNLEEYVKTIQKLEMKHHDILKENKNIDDWVETFHKLTKLLPKMQKKGLTLFKNNIQAMKALGGY